jgi:hypothetical protein
VIVGRRSGRHERIDVRNRHEHLGAAATDRLGHGQLVEIARIVVVDRRPQQAARVAHPTVLRRHRRGAAGLVERGGRELGKQAVAQHRTVRDVSEDVAMGHVC